MTLLGSKTWGDGYVQGTEFSGYTYFLNISKRLNDKHQLSFTAFGAPQEHFQRKDALTLADWKMTKTTSITLLTVSTATARCALPNITFTTSLS